MYCSSAPSAVTPMTATVSAMASRSWRAAVRPSISAAVRSAAATGTRPALTVSSSWNAARPGAQRHGRPSARSRLPTSRRGFPGLGRDHCLLDGHALAGHRPVRPQQEESGGAANGEGTESLARRLVKHRDSGRRESGGKRIAFLAGHAVEHRHRPDPGLAEHRHCLRETGCLSPARRAPGAEEPDQDVGILRYAGKAGRLRAALADRRPADTRRDRRARLQGPYPPDQGGGDRQVEDLDDAEYRQAADHCDHAALRRLRMSVKSAKPAASTVTNAAMISRSTTVAAGPASSAVGAPSRIVPIRAIAASSRLRQISGGRAGAWEAPKHAQGIMTPRRRPTANASANASSKAAAPYSAGRDNGLTHRPTAAASSMSTTSPAATRDQRAGTAPKAVTASTNALRAGAVATLLPAETRNTALSDSLASSSIDQLIEHSGYT